MKGFFIKVKELLFDVLEQKNNLNIMKMKKLLFTNWHLMRLVRLILAFGIAFHAVSTENYFFLFFAFFFLIQALFDTGCGSRGCSISPTDITNEK